ncbi:MULTISPECIES: hypothetical protein [Brachybacterium]|uniref:Rv3651-like N-terminal domain-containing protein n=1 Tax=Brachybacterium kimchii TaxID=2942909 RepID=A0ABY4N9W8_9MICO|nr:MULTISPECIES: hypothetical protein [Brachybacterium]MCG7308043.1 hypothetical protein [Brachybacterium sp. ACRRE]UQN30592.1 hypothetical protein M4486_04570 [Brachybacterium kimchii]
MTIEYAVGSWGLFCGDERRQLVMIDDAPYGPSSARKSMQATPRRLLLDDGRIDQVYSTGVPLDEVAAQGGSSWRVLVRPVHSPRSSTLIAVFAIVLPLDAPVPEQPLVGCWEWEIASRGYSWPTSHRRTYWDENLFKIYGISTDVIAKHGGSWEAEEWTSNLIARSDQMRINSAFRNIIQDGINGDANVFRCLTYHIVAGYGADGERETRHLRLVGKVAPYQPTDETILIHGFSYPVSEEFHDAVFGQDISSSRVDEVLRGVMGLAPQPTAVLDVATLDTLMTSASWKTEHFGNIRAFGELVTLPHEDLRSFIARAAADHANPHSTDALVHRPDGVVTPARLTAIGVSSSIQGQDVVVRLDL